MSNIIGTIVFRTLIIIFELTNFCWFLFKLTTNITFLSTITSWHINNYEIYCKTLELLFISLVWGMPKNQRL